QNSSQAVTNFGPLPELIKLAEQGDAKAQHRLGLIYFLGQGVPKDDAEGLKWFRKAADQGLADAQAMLGAYYREHKEWAEAIKWFGKAGDQGEEEAQCNLGVKYDSGDDVVQAC